MLDDLFAWAAAQQPQRAMPVTAPVPAAPAEAAELQETPVTWPRLVLPPGCATWADVQQALASTTALPAVMRRDGRSAVATACRVLGKAASELALAPSVMGPLLQASRPVRFGIGRRRWSNVGSILVALARAAGAHAQPLHLHRVASPAWQALLATRPAGGEGAALRALSHFADRSGIEPDAVSDDLLLGYAAWLRQHTYFDARTVVACGRRAWNRHVRRHPGQNLAVLAAPRDPRITALPDTAFPDSMWEERRGYLDSLRQPDPFDPLSRKALSPVTIDERRRYLTRAASMLVAMGMPASRLTGLAVLTEPANAKAILLRMFEQAGGRWSTHAQQMAALLLDVARRWQRLDEAALAPLQAYRRMVRPASDYLGNRSRRRLAQFNDPRALHRLLELPQALFERAADSLKGDASRKASPAPRRAASEHERGLALLFLLHLPLRRRNLETLDLMTHFERDERGRLERLRIPPDAVKNRVELSFDLPVALRHRLRQHLERYRPHIPGAADSTLLFPGRAGAARQPGTLSKGVVREVHAATGLDFNLHLMRHLAASLLYEAEPENGPVVQRLLGHNTLRTTEMMYGTVTTRSATDKWGRVLERKRQALAQRKGSRR